MSSPIDKEQWERIKQIEFKSGLNRPAPLDKRKMRPAERLEQFRYQALMKAEITPGGSTLVRCPYCIIYFRQIQMVDVTKFVDRDGKKEVTAYCLRGHTLRFRQVDQWREERQKLGMQRVP